MRNYATEIAADENAPVLLLRDAPGAASQDRHRGELHRGGTAPGIVSPTESGQRPSH